MTEMSNLSLIFGFFLLTNVFRLFTCLNINFWENQCLANGQGNGFEDGEKENGVFWEECFVLNCFADHTKHD
jgi:hypothetical protein